MKVRIFSMLLLVVAFASSCKKSKDNTPVTGQSNYTFILQPLQVSGDTVGLRWTVTGVSDSLLYYDVSIVTDTTSSLGSEGRRVIGNLDHYTDTLEAAPYIQYQIRATYRSKDNVTYQLFSNKQIFVRTDLQFLHIAPSDVLYDSVNQKLIFYTFGGQLMQYDLPTHSVTKNIQLDTIGTCSIGLYNGTEELYVPRANGELLIYNAASFTLVDTINVGGVLGGAAVTNNSILYVSANGQIKTYKRATKQLISVSSTALTTTLSNPVNGGCYAIENFDEYDAITGLNNQYEDLEFFKIDNAGHCVGTAPASFPYTFGVPSDFTTLPNGRLLGGYDGTIYDSTLARVGSIGSDNSRYVSYSVDEANQVIYAPSDTKNIFVFSLIDYHLEKIIGTRGFPFKVFYYDGKIISVSSNTDFDGSWQTPSNYCTIEIFAP